MVAAAGSVRIQAMPISRATPQRTAESRRVLPTPITDPIITWVVEMGAAITNAVRYSTVDAVSSATKPCTGRKGKIRRPSVRIIRQPPE